MSNNTLTVRFTSFLCPNEESTLRIPDLKPESSILDLKKLLAAKLTERLRAEEEAEKGGEFKSLVKISHPLLVFYPGLDDGSESESGGEHDDSPGSKEVENLKDSQAKHAKYGSSSMDADNEKALVNDKQLADSVTLSDPTSVALEFRYIIKARLSKGDLESSNISRVCPPERFYYYLLSLETLREPTTLVQYLHDRKNCPKVNRATLHYDCIAKHVFGTDDEDYLDAVLYENPQGQGGSLVSFYYDPSDSITSLLDVEGENYLSGNFKHYSSRLAYAAMLRSWWECVTLLNDISCARTILDPDTRVIKFIHHLVRVGSGTVTSNICERRTQALLNRILWRAPGTKGEVWCTELLNLLRTMMERHGDWYDPELDVESVLKSLERMITECRSSDWFSAVEVAQLLVTKVKEAHPERSRRYYEYYYRDDFPSPLSPVTVAALPQLQITSISKILMSEESLSDLDSFCSESHGIEREQFSTEFCYLRKVCRSLGEHYD